MRESFRHDVGESANAVRLLDYAFEQPLLNIRMAEQHLGCAYVTAANAIDVLVRRNVLQ